MKNSDQIIILIITFLAAGLTWKMVFDFYKTKLHKIFTHLISVITASFMLLSTTFLFMNKDYQRGGTEPEMILSAQSFAILFAMLFVIFIFFKYIPSRK
ncbi:hypothetical protein [uncultured Arcobacter sp.]|uniref:hypothetical protein n=1 Tax=uncultured Arcobacter sp. TaxID=165434 RepID=UPI002601E4A2|nr:hypothetical protein [uncultured Arcobacter sp.]